MAEFGIDVVVDPRGAETGMDKVDNRLRRTEKNAKKLGGALRRMLTLVGVLAAARQIGVFADSLTNVENRIRLVTKNTAQLNAVTKRLFDISARTRTGFAATATIFSRTALAVKDLGLSLDETLGFTEALNQAIVLSGVKAQEANAGLIQLSQGLASGTLRGDELRSVLEQLPKVADLIADQLGVLRGELRLMGEQGLISTKQIINAFTGLAAADLNKAFADSVPTMSQGFSVLTTRIIEFIGQADEASNISGKLAKGLIFVAENLDTIAKVAIVAGAALVGPFAKAGVLFATRAVLALNVAILANPFGALVILVLGTIAAIDQFGDRVAVSADGLVSLRDVAVATWDFIKEGVLSLAHAMKQPFADAINFIIKAFDGLNLSWAKVANFGKTIANRIIGHFVGLGRALKSVFNDLGLVFNDVIGQGFTKGITDSVKAVSDFAIKSLEVIKAMGSGILEDFGLIAKSIDTTIAGVDINPNSFVGTFLTIGTNAKDAYLSALKEDFVGDTIAILTPALAKIDAAARKISEKRRKVVIEVEEDQGLGTKGVKSDTPSFAFRQMVNLLGEESIALQGNSREREVSNELLKKTETLRKANSAATPEQKEVLRALIEYNFFLQEQADTLEDIKGPQDELTRRQDTVNALYLQGAINLNEMNQEMVALNIAQAELNMNNGTGGFADGFIVGLGDMLENVKSFTSEAGLEFGNFFDGLSSSFSNAIGNALVFGDSLKEAIGNTARSALAGLLSGLIDLGIQFIINAAMGNAMAASSTAAGIAMAAASAAAWAPAAAAASLASFGANAVPAATGISSTYALSATLSKTGFADGGFVTGPGGPRSDSIDARLSNGEFVVNAKSTARFRPQLEAMNDSSSGSGSNASNSDSSSTPAAVAGGGQTPQNIRIINIQDPAVVGDYLSSAAGEKVLLNVLERNSSSVKQIIG